MSSEQITSMSPETVESKIDSIYEKMQNPDIQLMVEEQISELTQQLPEFKGKTPKEIYERFWGTYTGTPKELAKVFSYTFRKVRDGVKIKDKFIQVNLQNFNSTLSIHQDGDINNIIGSLNHGVTIKSLQETTQLKGHNFLKIEFFSTDGSVKTGYISEDYTKVTDTKSLKQLNGYIRSIGLNPTKELKKDIFQKVYFLKDYNENKTRDNNEVYHKLVQDYELRKLIELEECRLTCLAELDLIKNQVHQTKSTNHTIHQHLYPEGIISEFGYQKDGLTSDDIMRESTVQKSKLQQELDLETYVNGYIPDFFKSTKNSSKDKIQVPLIDPNNIPTDINKTPHNASKLTTIKLEKKDITNTKNIVEQKKKIPQNENPYSNSVESELDSPSFILNKIKNNPNITSYLESKYQNDNFEENLNRFQKAIGSSGNDFKSLVMTYTYLYQHSFNNGSSIQLGEYYKYVTRNNWGDLTSVDRNNLFKQYAGEVNEIYSGKKMSNNLTILRGLIIQNELGSKIEKKIQEEKLKPIDIYKEIGLKTSDLRYFNITEKERLTKNFMCSRKVADQLQEDGFDVIRDHSENLYNKGINKYGVSSLISQLQQQAQEKQYNVFDLAIQYTKKDGSLGYHRTIAKLLANGDIYTKDNYHQGYAQNINDFPLNKKNAQYVIVSMHKQTKDNS